MVMAAHKTSQLGLHMAVAFTIMYFFTGSLAFGGLAAVLEPVTNVALLPVFERACAAVRAGAGRRVPPAAFLAAQKTAQVVLHMAVAFAVMFLVTGSLAFGGLAAVLEPVANVLLLPFHERCWARLRRKLARNGMVAA